MNFSKKKTSLPNIRLKSRKTMIHLILTKKAMVEISAKTKEFRLNALNKNFKLSYKNRKPTKSVSKCSPWIMQLSSLLSKIDYCPTAPAVTILKLQ